MIDPTKVTRIVLQRLLTETLLKFIFLAISIVCDFFKLRSMYLSAHLYGFFCLRVNAYISLETFCKLLLN